MGAALGAVVILPTAATATPTIRVEGGAGTVIPTTPVPRSAAPVTVTDTVDANTLTVPGRSATAQLSRATLWHGLPLGFDIFNFGGPSSFINQIGAEKTPPSFSPSWRLKVNHTATDTGSDATTLARADSVLWSYDASFDAPELDVTLSKETVRPGRALTASIGSYDNAGKASPASTATLRVAGRSIPPSSSGVASLRPSRIGPNLLSATAPGATRSPLRLLCVTGPELRPCSAVTWPKPGRQASPRIVGGLVARVGKTMPRVSVSIAQLAGAGQCRFVTRSLSGLTPARSCGMPVTIPVTVDVSGAWALPFPQSDAAYAATSGFRLPAGRYVVSSRARYAGVRETLVAGGVNTVRLRVSS
jgi:hypothetical protein